MKLIVFISILGLFVHSFAADSSEKNARIPLRAIYEDKAAIDLSISDFILLEGGKKSGITDFKTRMKKISDPGAPGSQPRHFTLVFQITGYSPHLQTALDYTFTHFFHHGDRLTIIINDNTLSWDIPDDKAALRLKIDELLKTQSQLTLDAVKQDVKFLESLVTVILDRKARESNRRGRGGIHIHYYMKYVKVWLDQYVASLQEFKKKYILPKTIPNYETPNSSTTTSPDSNRWIIYFYQLPSIPELSRGNRDRIQQLIDELFDSELKDELTYSDFFSKILESIDVAFNDVRDFPVKSLIDTCYKQDTSLSGIFLETQNDEIPGRKKYRHLASGITKYFKEAALQTGGVFSSTGSGIETINQALELIKNKEDVYYILSYSPSPGNEKKIKIEWSDKKNKKFALFYNNNEGDDRAEPSIRIDELSFRHKKLTVNITDFMSVNDAGETKGKISLHIRIKEVETGKTLFDQSKIMISSKKNIDISIIFNWMNPGKYDITVEAIDLQTGKRDSRSTGVSCFN